MDDLARPRGASGGAAARRASTWFMPSPSRPIAPAWMVARRVMSGWCNGYIARPRILSLSYPLNRQNSSLFSVVNRSHHSILRLAIQERQHVVHRPLVEDLHPLRVLIGNV